MTREESSNMSAGQDTEESNGQATSPVMVSAALGDHFAQALKDLARYDMAFSLLVSHPSLPFLHNA
ncbi:hypothetical protein B0T13DRAFT_307062 [Neurospora crassa]|nr:hypothetical protein B0T13DRAFT_307062 [Neurospora crassa]